MEVGRGVMRGCTAHARYSSRKKLASMWEEGCNRHKTVIRPREMMKTMAMEGAQGGTHGSGTIIFNFKQRHNQLKFFTYHFSRFSLTSLYSWSWENYFCFSPKASFLAFSRFS